MKLKELREARGLSQLKLAEISGVSQSFINYLEAGTKQPTLKTLEKLAPALGVTIGELVGEARASGQ